MFELTGWSSLLFQVPIGLLGLSFLVFIHEGGHFLVAKLVGVKVNTFSIGFGKKLIKWRRGETEYAISAIPLGGYVAMAGEQPGEEGDGTDRDFHKRPVPHRMAIALAGPVVNIAFAFLALALLYMAGVQEMKSSMIVGDVQKESPAAAAGLQPGDEILTLAGKSVNSWEDFLQRVALEAGNPLPLTIKRENGVQELSLIPEMHDKLGIAVAGVSGQGEIFVQKVIEDSPAQRAGLKPDDIILSVDDVKISSNGSLIELINKSGGQPVDLTIEREGQVQHLTLSPMKDEESDRFIIGIWPGARVPSEIVRRGPIESFQKSWNENVKFVGTMFHTIKGLVTGQVKLKALSGPIGIVQMIGNSLHRSIQQFVWMMAIISLNLGLMNLLPLAITDGGVIVFLLLEALRRKPLDPALQMRINQVAISFFILLAAFVIFQDIMRIPWFLN